MKIKKFKEDEVQGKSPLVELLTTGLLEGGGVIKLDACLLLLKDCTWQLLLKEDKLVAGEDTKH